MGDSKRGVTSEAEDEISDVMLYRMGDVVPTDGEPLEVPLCAHEGVARHDGLPVRSGRQIEMRVRGLQRGRHPRPIPTCVTPHSLSIYGTLSYIRNVSVCWQTGPQCP